MRMITSQDLLLVLSIAEEGSITAAAERLTTSQPALSRTLGELERRLGAKLFERHPRGMAPTPIGEALARHGRAVLAVTQRARHELDVRLASDTIELQVGIVPQLSVMLFARVLASLQKLEQPVRVQARVGSQEDLVSELRRGNLDLFVGPLSYDPDFIALPLFEDRPVLIVRYNHPLVADGRGDDLTALAAYPWVMPPANDHVTVRLRALFEDEGLDPPEPAIVTTDVPLSASLAMDSDFVAVLPHDVALFAQNTGRALILPLELPSPRSQIGALRRREQAKRPEIDYFLTVLETELQHAGHLRTPAAG